QALGVRASMIDGITIVLPEIDPEARQPAFVVRVTTTRAYNRADVAAALKARGREPDVRRPLGNLVPLQGRGMVHFDDDKSFTLLPNDEGAIALLGRMLSRRQSGKLAESLTSAGGKNHIVASVDLTQLPRIPPNQLPAELRALRPLL